MNGSIEKRGKNSYSLVIFKGYDLDGKPITPSTISKWSVNFIKGFELPVINLHGLDIQIQLCLLHIKLM